MMTRLGSALVENFKDIVALNGIGRPAPIRIGIPEQYRNAKEKNMPVSLGVKKADEVLAKAIGGLVWTITQPSMINIDFADVRSIMGNGGVGFIAVGSGKGTEKVNAAAEAVLKNRLLDVDFEGASGALIHISGGPELTIGDAIKAGTIITDRMDPKANIKWGARVIPGYDDQVEIVAIVTGVKGSSIVGKVEEKSTQPYSDLEVVG